MCSPSRYPSAGVPELEELLALEELLELFEVDELLEPVEFVDPPDPGSDVSAPHPVNNTIKHKILMGAIRLDQ